MYFLKYFNKGIEEKGAAESQAKEPRQSTCFFRCRAGQTAEDGCLRQSTPDFGHKYRITDERSMSPLYRG